MIPIRRTISAMLAVPPMMKFERPLLLLGGPQDLDGGFDLDGRSRSRARS